MDFQVLILDYIFTERAGMMILLLAIIFYIFQQNKTLVAIENEILNVKSKINSLVNRTDDTTSDISSLSSRISNLSGVVSEANTVAEGTKKELSMLADGISNETVFNEAIDLARKGGSVDDIVKQTKLSKDQAETIVRFHGSTSSRLKTGPNER
jgi:signal transduction histidine kinase